MSASTPRPELAPAAIYVDADGTVWTPGEHPEDAGTLIAYPLTMYLPAMVQQSAVHAFPRPPEDEPGEPDPRVKTYIHERPEGVRCQTEWTEHDTMAPHAVRHECERSPHPDDDQHVCTCGLIEVAA